MHLPPRFAETDAAVLRALADRHPFAVLLTESADEGCTVSDVPAIFPEGRTDVLHTHLAAAIPQARTTDGAVATAIFSGPHGYISPNWCAAAPTVPTWNYAAVHVAGPVRVLTAESDRYVVLRELTQRFETPDPDAWDFDALPPGFRDGQMKAIVILEIRVERLIGKFKLSQNRSAEDRTSVIRHLEQSERPDDRALAAMMRSRPGIVRQTRPLQALDGRIPEAKSTSWN